MRRVFTVLAGASLVLALVFVAPAMAARSDVTSAPARVVAPVWPRANARPSVQEAVLYRNASSRVGLIPVEDRAVARGGRGDRDFDHRGFNGGFAFGGFGGPSWWAPYGYGYWWPGYNGFGDGYPYYYYPQSFSGGLKLKVEGPAPKHADVFANGAYVGTVNDFNGTFQQLSLRPGLYNIQIRAKGYQPLTFKVHIQPDRTITYRGEMQKAA